MADKIDLRVVLSGVRDQLHRSTCLAFAVTTAHEHARAEDGDYSEEALYWGAKIEDGDWDGGTTFESVTSALLKQGQPLSTVWPYDPTVHDGQPYYPPAGSGPDETWLTASLQAVAPTPDTISAELTAGRLVAIGLLLTDAFANPVGGEILMPPENAQTHGGHAVIAVGFDRTARVVTIRNSWGHTWGSEGYANLPFDYFSKYVLAARTLSASLGAS